MIYMYLIYTLYGATRIYVSKEKLIRLSDTHFFGALSCMYARNLLCRLNLT